jgi:hypothetical protein
MLTWTRNVTLLFFHLIAMIHISSWGKFLVNLFPPEFVMLSCLCQYRLVGFEYRSFTRTRHFSCPKLMSRRHGLRSQDLQHANWTILYTLALDGLHALEAVHTCANSYSPTDCEAQYGLAPPAGGLFLSVDNLPSWTGTNPLSTLSGSFTSPPGGATITWIAVSHQFTATAAPYNAKNCCCKLLRLLL